MEGDDWIDMTPFGSVYEVQILANGRRQRHRPLRFNPTPVFGDERGIGEWRPGPPPET